MASTEKFKIRSAVYLIPVQDDKVLISRRFNTGYMDGNYSLVAGHIDGKESNTQAMVREAQEEAGITINPKDLEMMHVMHRYCPDGMEYMDFFFTCKTWEGEPQIIEKDKCDDMKWVTLDQLPENTLQYIRSAFNHCKEGKYYSEFGWE